jgi:hypothetical protein
MIESGQLCVHPQGNTYSHPVIYPTVRQSGCLPDRQSIWQSIRQSVRQSIRLHSLPERLPADWLSDNTRIGTYIQPFVRRNVWPTSPVANQTLIRLQGGTVHSMIASPAGDTASRLPVCFYFCLFHLTVNYLSVYIIIRLFV